MQAIVVERLGGPEELQVAERPCPQPGHGEIRVDVTVAGVNFMDTGARRLGPAGGQVPFVPGAEGASRVSALGERVTEFAVGGGVAWVYAYTSYAEQLVLPAASVVPVPGDIPDEAAASVMMQGITAHFATEAAPVASGQVTLVHAAARGLGQNLTQLVKARGGTVIGVTATPAGNGGRLSDRGSRAPGRHRGVQSSGEAMPITSSISRVRKGRALTISASTAVDWER